LSSIVQFDRAPGQLVLVESVLTKIKCAVAEIADDYAGSGTIRTVIHDDVFLKADKGDNLGLAGPAWHLDQSRRPSR
jgi:hypothetical protein